MATDQRPGTVHWIDHIVVGTNDLGAWLDWAEKAIGVKPTSLNGLTTASHKRGQPVAAFCDMGDGSCHVGAFLQNEELPPIEGLDPDGPRYGFFVRAEEIDQHIHRFDQHGILHSDPVRTSAEGDEGTAVYFADPDGNQYELWAPTHMPEGAMEVSTPHGVGRVSSASYSSRDLQRTADFFDRFFDLEPMDDPEVPEDTMVFAFAAGGRLVYHLRDQDDERATGHGPWFAMHAAFTVGEDQYFSNYRRLWDGVPEEPGVKETINLPEEEEKRLPARTGLHGSPAGRLWKERYQRGDEIYDWDGHAFHYIGGISASADGSLSRYKPKEQMEYFRELADSLAGGSLPS